MAANSSGNVQKETTETDKQTLLAVLQFLKKQNLKGTEEALRREVSCAGIEENVVANSDISSALSEYSSEGDPTKYEQYYTGIQEYIEKSLDVYKPELGTILYPLFVHMYLDLIYQGHDEKAKSFLTKFRDSQEDYYQEDIVKLASVTHKEHVEVNDLMLTLRSNKFVIKLSRESYQALKKKLQETQNNLVLNLIQQHLQFDVFDGRPRSKEAVTSAAGAVVGEPTNEANKGKVLHGIAQEPDLGVVLPEDDPEDEEEKDKPKKKKTKKEGGQGKKKKEFNPDAPKLDRIPFPDLKDREKVLKATMLKETAKMLNVDGDTLPSVCLYTFLNAHQGLNTITFSDDSNLICGGFENSSLRIWTLTPRKLRALKPATELARIDKDAEDVFERILDDKSAAESKTLIGHSGPVYGASFNCDNSLLLTSSEDKTVRLWSLFTYTNIVCYKGHNYPVWDVQFSPKGHYFASCSHDSTARLWTTENPHPLRIFAGHFSDVNTLRFHPNCNYIATGSCDRTVRLWDITSGQCVRVFTGHKGAVQSLDFTPDGRYFASSGVDKKIILWDIPEARPAAEFSGHTDTVYSLRFSRDGHILASGGSDCCVKLWSAQNACNKDDDDDLMLGMDHSGRTKQMAELASFPTKATPVHCLHFTWRNLLLSAGPFDR